MENFGSRSGLRTIEGYPGFDENYKRRLYQWPYLLVAVAFLVYALVLLLSRGLLLENLLVLAASLFLFALILWRLSRRRQLILLPQGFGIRWANDRGGVKAVIPYPEIKSIAFHIEGKPKSDRRRMYLATTEKQLAVLQMHATSVVELQSWLSRELRARPTGLTWEADAGETG